MHLSFGKEDITYEYMGINDAHPKSLVLKSFMNPIIVFKLVSIFQKV